MKRYVKKPPTVLAQPWDGGHVEGAKAETDGRPYFPGCWGQKQYLTPGCVILYRLNHEGKPYPCSALTRDKFDQEWEEDNAP